MTRTIYSLLFYLLLPAVMVRVYWRSIREPDYASDIGQRFGMSYPVIDASASPVWVHAVSAGETIAARELVKRLVNEGFDVIVSNMTPAGRERSREIFGETVLNVYAPYDLPTSVSAFIKWARPRAFIVIDTELWPNTVALCRDAGIPVYLVNGRLSEKSARGYQRGGGFIREMFKSLSHVFAQSPSQAQRFEQLGSRSVTAAGSVKFDARLPDDFGQKLEVLQSALHRQFIVLGASTHEGEESALLDAFSPLASDDTLLILAPRHTHRTSAVVQQLQRSGLAFQLHSDAEPLAQSTRVYLLDTMGELIYFYGVCQVAFVGGSLVDVGGHNPMEPGGLGKPILMGPYRRNIADIAEQFEESGALDTVTGAADLQERLKELCENEALQKQMSEAALKTMEQNRGALDRVCNVLLPLIRENKP